MLSAKSALKKIYARTLEAGSVKATLDEMLKRGLPKELYKQYMDEAIDIGLVCAAMGQRWFTLTLDGFAAHAGTTPMHSRRDALTAFAELALKVEEIGYRHAPDGRATTDRSIASWRCSASCPTSCSRRSSGSRACSIAGTACRRR